MIGKTTSHYKILEKLGEGGMGVVYRAEDITLRRHVALKFLSQEWTRDPDAKARFMNEARAASALDHNNICTVHEIDETEDGQLFIVMAFYEGETVREKIERGPLPLAEAIDLAIQIAEGLAKAHQKTIVHRDLKPANVLVTQDCVAKIVDFGLAKLAGCTKLTKEGTTLGTASYMSPEQAAGETVDQRSDIFSFGVLVYEMVAGQLPFKGDSDQAVIYSIMLEEPKPLTGLRTGVPMDLERTVVKCLEKEPAERYQNVGDILIDLRRAKKETGNVSRKPPAEMPGQTPTVNATGKIVPKILGLAGGVITILILAIFFLRPDGPTKLNPDMSFRVLSTPYPEINYPSLSRDGNWIAFPSKDPDGLYGIYFMNSRGGDARLIATDSTRLESADISPDGSRVVYSRWYRPDQLATLFVVSSMGGQPTQLVEKGVYPEWRPDGQRIGYMLFADNSESRLREFRTVRPDGSDNRREYISTADSLTSVRIDFSWSPDGKSLAWLRTFPGPSVEIILIDLESGEERQLTFDQKIIDEVRWTTQDDILFSSTRSGNTNLWMMPAQGGEAVQITKGSGPDIGMAISSDMKKLLYLQKLRTGNIWTANSDGNDSRQITFEDQLLQWPEISHDGNKIVYVLGDPDPTKDSAVGNIYVMDRGGHNRRLLRSENETVKYPHWSPNDDWILYHRGFYSPQASVYAIPSDVNGRTQPRFISKGSSPLWINSQSICFQNRDKRTNFLISLQGGEPRPIYQDSTNAVPIMGGDYLFFRDYRKGREGFYVISSVDAQAHNSNGVRKIGESNVANWALSPDRRFLLEYHQPGEIWRVSLPKGKRQRLGGAFTNPSIEVRSINFSYDDKEAVYVTKRISGKLVLIEDFIK